eukprot:1148191-Pelagomonas_calceolata.AAC.3
MLGSQEEADASWDPAWPSHAHGTAPYGTTSPSTRIGRLQLGNDSAEFNHFSCDELCNSSLNGVLCTASGDKKPGTLCWCNGEQEPL